MSNQPEQIVAEAIQRTPVAVVLTDARAEDNPITFVNEAFEVMTLYNRDFAVGRNCRFLQGEKTEPEAVERIRQGVASETEFMVTLTNYKADGTPFRNQVLISPVFDKDEKLLAYLSVQRQVGEDEADQKHDAHALNLLRELQHRVKNHLSMVVSMIRMQARARVTAESFRAIGRRIEALALLYEEMFIASQADHSSDRIKTGAYLSRIASTVSRISGESAIRVNVDCEEIDLPVDQAARLGLLLSELLTNALEHAFEGRESGLVNVRFRELSGGGVRLSVEDDGIGLPEGIDWPYDSRSVRGQTDRAEKEEGKLDTTGQGGHSGVGGSIVVALTEMLGATLDVTRALQGTTISVDLEAAD